MVTRESKYLEDSVIGKSLRYILVGEALFAVIAYAMWKNPNDVDNAPIMLVAIQIAIWLALAGYAIYARSQDDPSQKFNPIYRKEGNELHPKQRRTSKRTRQS